MAMNQGDSERWVIVSALVVAGVYGYRRLTQPTTDKPTAKNMVTGPVPKLGAFATAWGFTFLAVSILSEANPGLGGAFAISIAAADFLTNSVSLFSSVQKQESAGSGLSSIGSAASALGTAAQAQTLGGALTFPANPTVSLPHLSATPPARLKPTAATPPRVGAALSSI